MKLKQLLVLSLINVLGPSVASANPGDVFVEADGQVIRITPDGTQYPFATSFGAPKGLAFDYDHNLYVADYGAGNIARFTPDGQRSVFSTNGGPYAIAFDGAGNLYGAYYFQGIEFTPPGGGGHGTNFAGGAAAFTYGLAFDAGGNYYVSGYPDRIYKFAPGALIGTLFATNLNDPRGLAFDRQGNLYAADLGSGNIYNVFPRWLAANHVCLRLRRAGGDCL